MKKISIVFGALAIILSDVMCAVVAYSYCNMAWLGEKGATSAPPSIAFLYAIPYIIGISISVVLSVVFYIRHKNTESTAKTADIIEPVS